LKIHPTALIDPKATLGSNIEVGAFSIIGAEVSIGDDSIVGSHVVLEGSVHIARGNNIGHGTLIGGWPQDLSFKPATQSGVRIGEDNVIREHCTIHRGTAEGTTTEIGAGNFLMAGAHVGHNCTIGNGVIIANNCLLAGYVRIDDGAFLGGGSVFHQFTHVGRLVITQGSSGFGKAIPPFLIAGQVNRAFGVNAVGLRRAGFSSEERAEANRAFKLLYRSGLNTRQAIEQSAASDFGPLGREFFAFVAGASKRGIVASTRDD
jgi:UDP-N-acetylglucosamine acyltransferase